MSLGALAEFANFTDGDVDSPPLSNGEIAYGIRETARWSVRLYGRYKVAGGKLAFTHDLYAIPSFTDPRHDYRWMAYVALDAPVAKGFSARVQADATREGIIVQGTKQTDLVVTFGASYRGEWLEQPTHPPAAPAAGPANPSPGR